MDERPAETTEAENEAWKGLDTVKSGRQMDGAEGRGGTQNPLKWVMSEGETEME